MSWFDNYPVMQTVIVNTKTGKAFRGVIWQRKGGFLIMRNAELLKPGGERVAIDGELLIPEKDVEFLQIPQAVS